MKKSVIVLLFNLWTLCSFGQIYGFSTYNSVYTPLDNPISLNNGVPWVSLDYTVPIGFDFNFFNTSIDTLYFVPDQGSPLLSSSNAEGGVHKLINPYGAVLIDRGYMTSTSLSPVSYQLSGSAPERVLKIEWKNCGFYFDLEDDGQSVDFINYQLWLYESDGKIEVHFGPQKISQPNLAYNYETGPQVSLIPAYYVDLDSISTASQWLDGPATNPAMVVTGLPVFMDGDIPVNKVFCFTNLTVGLKPSHESECRVFPNPFNDDLTLELPLEFSGPCLVEIYNLAGCKLYSEQLNKPNNSNEIRIQPGLKQDGSYLFKISSRNVTASRLVLKTSKR
jgi:hypothetical protein